MKPLGMGTTGHIATYGIGLAMLILTLLLGFYWNKKLPSTVKEEGWTTRVVAKIAILAAVAAAGGMITIPELQEKAKLTLVSSVSIVEGGAHDVTLRSTSSHN